MSASIQWKGMNEARQLLQGLIKKTDSLEPLMEDIGAHGVSSTQIRIADEKRSPDGAKWADYKDPKYAARKAKKSSGGLLEHSGMLIRSMTSNAGKNSVEWGSNREYAATHQFGRGNIVARPFLGISNKDSQVIGDLIRQYYDK